MNSFCIWLTCTAADKHLITKINNASGNYLWPNIPIGGLHRLETIEELESMCRTLLSGPRTIERESSAEISWWPDNFHATIPLFINKCLYKKCHYFPVNLKNRWLVSYFDDKSSTFISDNFFYDLFHRRCLSMVEIPAENISNYAHLGFRAFSFRFNGALKFFQNKSWLTKYNHRHLKNQKPDVNKLNNSCFVCFLKA